MLVLGGSKEGQLDGDTEASQAGGARWKASDISKVMSNALARVALEMGFHDSAKPVQTRFLAWGVPLCLPAQDRVSLQRCPLR